MYDWLVAVAMGPEAALACTIVPEEEFGKHHQKPTDNHGSEEARLKRPLSSSAMKNSNVKISRSIMNGVSLSIKKMLLNMVQWGCRINIKIAKSSRSP